MQLPCSEMQLFLFKNVSMMPKYVAQDALITALLKS